MSTSTKKKNREINLDFDLWPKQVEAIESFAQELLYGGAAGGGKSHVERVESIKKCMEVPGLQYFLFRRNFQDLIKSYVEGPTGYQAMLGPLIHDPDVKDAEIVAKEIRFPFVKLKDGTMAQSKIYLCHCQHDKNVLQFGSFEFHVLNIAEAGEFTEFMLKFLRSRVRMPEQFIERLPANYRLREKYWMTPGVAEYTLPRILMTANPVGPGKAYLKKNFVDGNEGGNRIWRASEEDGGMLRQYIPARLNDNPSLNPVQYAAKLKGIGSKGYVDALLAGKWDVPIGAFFPQIDKELHLVRNFMIPDHWPKFMVMDWGACGEGDPFSIGYYTLACEEVALISAISKRKLYCARDSIICYDRINGGDCGPGGSSLPKVDASQIANVIHEREKLQGYKILFRVAGGDIVQQRGVGTSVFKLFHDNGIRFRRADDRRANGWAQVDYRLYGENGSPLSFWTENCELDLDSIGNLQYHDIDLSDIANNQNDHDGDRHRYACMCRLAGKAAIEKQEKDYRNKNEKNVVADIVKQISQPETRRPYGRR